MSGYGVGWKFPPLITRISEGRSYDTRPLRLRESLAEKPADQIIDLTA